MAGITYTIGADGKPLIEAMDKAAQAVERFKKLTTNNEAAVRVAKLQTDADKARVAGQELLAKKIENEIALEQRLIAIRHSGATQAQKDDLEDHARTQRVIADRQAEINQAQKLANIQRGNMPGQPMSEGAKRFRMMNVSAQLQDVAVQAQMGTSISTIAGQQGPQLISALGGTGAMAGAAAGAAIAIGITAGIIQGADTAHKAFQNMVSDSRTAGAEISKIIGGARNQKDIEAGLTKGAEALKTIKEQEDMLYKGGAGNGFHRAMIRMNAFVAGGPKLGEVGEAVAKERAAQDFYRVQLNEKSLYLSGEQVKRSKMIAEGDERGVAALDRRLKMEGEIFEISMSQLGVEQRKAAEAAIRTQHAADELVLEKARSEAIQAALDSENADIEIIKTRLSGNSDLADELERQLKLTKEIQAINKRKDMTPAEQAAAINAVSEKAQIEQQAKKEAKDKNEYDADIAQKKRNAEESLQITADLQKRVADEEEKKRAIVQKDLDEQTKLHEKADADISKALDSIEERRKAKLKPEQRLAEAKAEMEKAREIFGKFAPGSLKQKQSAGLLAEKTMEFEKLRQEKREKDIQRAMGGSRAEAEARRSERAEQRARARAERIVTNREVEAKRAEMERDRKPQKEINAALDAIRAVKKPEVKDAQADIKKATESSAASLIKLLGIIQKA